VMSIQFASLSVTRRLQGDAFVWQTKPVCDGLVPNSNAPTASGQSGAPDQAVRGAPLRICTSAVGASPDRGVVIEIGRAGRQ